MPLFRRPEGTYLRDVHPLRKLMPHLMPGRNESIVYFEQELRVGKALAWLDARNARGGPKLTFFHLVLAGVVRALAERPQMNRFVVGRRLYQRDAIELSFAVKKRMADDAPLTTVKIRFVPGDGVDNDAGRVDEAIGVGRGEAQTSSEKEVALVTKLPGFLVRLAFWLQRTLDGLNLLPAAMIRPDPMYASMFLANLGSVGLDAPFHHLYEYGTIPLFGVIGRIQKAPVVTAEGTLAVDDVVRLRWSFDERIADGFYCARSLDLFKAWLEDPSTLEPR